MMCLVLRNVDREILISLFIQHISTYDIEIDNEVRQYIIQYADRSYGIDMIQFNPEHHYNDVIMNAMASQITSRTIVYSSVYSSAYQRKYQSSASLAFVREIHRLLVDSPRKGPVTRKMLPFDDVITRRTFLSSVCIISVLGQCRVL